MVFDTAHEFVLFQVYYRARTQIVLFLYVFLRKKPFLLTHTHTHIVFVTVLLLSGLQPAQLHFWSIHIRVTCY